MKLAFLIRRFPKFMLVAGVILGSSAIFLLWWNFRSPASGATEVGPILPAPGEDLSAKFARIGQRWDYAILADNTLYDAETGDVLATDWLKNGMPQRLFFDADRKMFIGQYEQGFVLYSCSGAKEKSLIWPNRVVLTDDRSTAFFCKDKDIRKAQIDWEEFRMFDEKQVTKMGIFTDAFFAQNVLVGTEKALIVREAMKILRVDMTTGEIVQSRLPIQNLGKRNSPDGAIVIGIENGELYRYDIETNKAESAKIGRMALNDFQWIGNDQCLVIAQMTSLMRYDRKTDLLKDFVNLPFKCLHLADPSPGGRFVFCMSQSNGVLVDTKTKTVKEVQGGAGVTWVANDTFAYTRDVPDSRLRGIWMQRVGSEERRVAEEPFLVARNGAKCVTLKAAGITVFAVSSGMLPVKIDEAMALPPIRLKNAPAAAMAILPWAKKGDPSGAPSTLTSAIQ